MNTTDLLEHELKFEIQPHPVNFEIVRKVLSSKVRLLDEGVKNVVDIYYDMNDYTFAKSSVSYRLRTVDNTKKIRVNLKFPGKQDDFLFIRREIRSKVKKSKINMERPLLYNCIANDYVKGFALNNGVLCKLDTFAPTMVVKTERKCYWAVHEEKDIAGKDLSMGLVYFDKCIFHLPDNSKIIKTLYEFEFELWNGGICEDVLKIHRDIGNQLCKEGLKPSKECKYKRFLIEFGILQ